MAIILDTTDYKAEYEKALLTEALGGTTLRTKATLLVFSSLLVVVSVFGLELKAIPGMSLEIPAGSPNPLEGMLALAVMYLLAQFALCFLQDYFRWRLQHGRASIAHSGKVLADLQQRVKELEAKSSSLEPFMGQFVSTVEELLKRLDAQSAQIKGIARSHTLLWILQFGRFWIIDLAVPVALACLGIYLSAGAAHVLLVTVWNAV